MVLVAIAFHADPDAADAVDERSTVEVPTKSTFAINALESLSAALIVHNRTLR